MSTCLPDGFSFKVDSMLKGSILVNARGLRMQKLESQGEKISRIGTMANDTDDAAVQPKVDFVDMSIAAVGGMAFAIVTLFLCVLPLSGEIVSGRDYIVFWVTGQQLVHHANPYDSAAIARMELAAGVPAKTGTLYMRNPPWSLLLALPLGFAGPRIGAVLWSLSLLACLVASVRILWRMLGSPRSSLPWLGISFAPALLCAIMGQTSLFALFGYVLFLDLHKRRPFLAGVSLWLCALKPHLFLLFGIILLAWIFISKSYKILAGAAVAMAASCAAVSWVDPTAWSDYLQMMRATGVQKEQVPCLSIALRTWISPQTIALTYLPLAFGCIWALSYFWRNRQSWDWLKNGSPLMLVALLTAPYSWVYDDGLAIPALLQGVSVTRSRILLAGLSFASLLFFVEFGCGIKINSRCFLWTAPAWLLWYLLSSVHNTQRDNPHLEQGMN